MKAAIQSSSPSSTTSPCLHLQRAFLSCAVSVHHRHDNREPLTGSPHSSHSPEAQPRARMAPTDGTGPQRGSAAGMSCVTWLSPVRFPGVLRPMPDWLLLPSIQRTPALEWLLSLAKEEHHWSLQVLQGQRQGGRKRCGQEALRQNKKSA